MDIARATLPPSAFPSSSNPTNELPYNIFINHHGPDTTHTLAASTYNTLKSMGFEVFLNREELELGDSFPSVIEGALRSSFLRIALLSPRYAESPLCLSELSYMLKTGKTIIPVFYNVDPSDVRLICKGKGIYAKAFSKHEAKAIYHSKILDWKRALEKVSFFEGYIVNNEESESAFLEKLQESIRNNSSDPHIQQEEMAEKITEIEQLIRNAQEKKRSQSESLIQRSRNISSQPHYIQEKMRRKSKSLELIQRSRNISSQPHYIQQVVSSALSVVETPNQQVIEILPPAVSSLQNQGNDGRTSSQNDVENRSGGERPSQQVEELLLLAVGSPQNQENDGQTSSQNDVENPRSGFSRTQIKEAVKEKWKYVNCSLVLVGISLTFFSSDLRSHTHLSPILVEITLLTVSVILGVLFFMIYDKIMKEHRVRRGNNEAAVFPCKPHQLILLALSSCVASAVYIYFAINELKKK